MHADFESYNKAHQQETITVRPCRKLPLFDRPEDGEAYKVIDVSFLILTNEVIGK